MTFFRSSLLASLGTLVLLGGCYDPKFADGSNPANGGFACDDSDPTTSECPSGQTCVGLKCVKSAGGTAGCVSTFTIPKSGTYSGTMSNPMLDTEAECPDAQVSTNMNLEPNDDSCHATLLPAVVVGGTPLKLQSLAICPTGNNPAASNHDIDVYQFHVTETTTALVEITYDVKYGDLDLGIFRSNGMVVASDGSAKSNACALASVAVGDYYLVVTGAGGTAVNRYSMSVRLGSGLTCN